MRELLRPMLPMIVILAIPIVPFLLFGMQVEAWLRNGRNIHPQRPPWQRS
jgi:hypothetical protein